MDIKPLRSMVGAYGRMRRNVIARGVPDILATDLIKRGLAVPAPVDGAKEEAAGTAPARPPEKAHTGGRTGKKAKRLSSSPADQRQPAKTSKALEDDAG